MTQTNSSVVTSLKLWEVELAKSFPRNNTRKRSERELTWGQPEPSLRSASCIWNCAKFFTVSYIPVKSSESSAYYKGMPFHLGIKSIEKTGIRVYKAGGNKIEKLPPPLSVHNTASEIGKLRIKLTRLREWIINPRISMQFSFVLFNSACNSKLANCTLFHSSITI